jgi:hypothetical protein
MGGRVYDPTTGRFMSVDPVMGGLGDSQVLNPYAYAGNRPLVSTDPEGLCVDGCVVEAAIVKVVASTIFSSAMGSIFGGRSTPPPPASAMPGRPVVSDAPLCGQGQASAACSGWVLSAAPSAAGGGVPTSSWVNEVSADDPYALENLEQLFVDLGNNTVDVLILAPYYDAADAYEAAANGHYAAAALSAGLAACDVARACEGAAAVLKPLARAGKKLTSASRAARNSAERELRTYRHYGYAEDASKFEGGLRPGGYATHSRGRPMTGASAQVRLALPHERPPNAYYKITVGPGVRVVGPGPVRPTAIPSRQGGGTEYVFPDGTPPGSVEGPFAIP